MTTYQQTEELEVVCPHCSQKLNGFLILDHVRFLCEDRPRECYRCDQMVIPKQYKLHRDQNCPKLPKVGDIIRIEDEQVKVEAIKRGRFFVSHMNDKEILEGRWITSNELPTP